MDRVSPHVREYRRMRDVVAQHAPLEISARIVATPGTDMRRYKKPKKYEPAVVFVSSDGTPPLDRDIVVWPRDPHYKTYHVSDESEHIDPLAYPLLFPYGDLGWHPQLRHGGERRTARNTRLTSIQFYAYRLMLRDYEPDSDDDDDVVWSHTEPSLPHSGGLLFQQWVCDALSRAEA